MIMSFFTFLMMLTFYKLNRTHNCSTSQCSQPWRGPSPPCLVSLPEYLTSPPGGFWLLSSSASPVAHDLQSSMTSLTASVSPYHITTGSVSLCSLQTVYGFAGWHGTFYDVNVFLGMNVNSMYGHSSIRGKMVENWIISGFVGKS